MMIGPCWHCGRPASRDMIRVTLARRDTGKRRTVRMCPDCHTHEHRTWRISWREIEQLDTDRGRRS